MRRRTESAVPGTVVDEANTPDQVRARVLREANANVGDYGHMTAAQCIATLHRMGGVAKAVRLPDLRQPGEDEE